MPTYLKYKYIYFSIRIKVGAGSEFFSAEPDLRLKMDLIIFFDFGFTVWSFIFINRSGAKWTMKRKMIPL